jgi:hypothetical protein
MNATLNLRHDTGARIAVKTPTPVMITRVKGNAMLISAGVSPIAATPVKVRQLTQVA